MRARSSTSSPARIAASCSTRCARGPATSSTAFDRRWNGFAPASPEGRCPMTHEVHSPLRDDRLLGPEEDLDRMPDGVPHPVVGLTALYSVFLAMLVAVL